MASSNKDKNKTKTLSVRERAEQAIEEASKPKKNSVNTDLTEVNVEQKSSPKKVKKETDKVKKDRRFHIVPKFIREAFKEIRLVTWPDARTTTKLTVAVIIFATVFALLISLVDYGFGKIFKKVFLNG